MREWKLGKPTRQAYGETLAELGEEYQEIVVLDADLSNQPILIYSAKNFLKDFLILVLLKQTWFLWQQGSQHQVKFLSALLSPVL